MYIVLLLMFLIGVFLFLKPDFLWMFERRWIAQEEEPSEQYRSFSRMIGVVIAVVAVMIAIFRWV